MNEEFLPVLLVYVDIKRKGNVFWKQQLIVYSICKNIDK